MVDIERINTGSFESYSRFLDGTLRVVDSVIDPCVVKYKGKEYVVSREDCVLAIVEDLGEDLMSYAIGLNEEGELETLVDEYNLYQILLHEEIPIVSKKSLSDKSIEQIFVTHQEDNKPNEYLYYYKMTEDGNAEIQLQYDITRFKDNLELFFNYANSRKADIIFLNHAKRFMKFIEYMKKNGFIKLTGYDEYGKVLIDNPNGYTILRTKSYHEDDIRQMAAMYGLGLSIPKEMMELFSGRSEKANTLQLIAQEYRKNIRD